MPNINQHQVEILSATREGNENYFINLRWKDSNGNILNEIGLQWNDASELQSFAADQKFVDLLRILVQAVLDVNGNVRNTIFDSLSGRTYRINVNISQVNV